ncbi:MAG: hypothetical protein GY743_18465, partial [Planctomycetaceae bacterium]|nr:hypothetical protein [Planctomycetaceae bacterium]
GSGFFHYQKRPYDSDSSFSGMRSERFKFNCRAVAEVYPNIFLLRNLSDDEELKQAEMLEEEKRNGRYTSPPMLKCSSGRRSSDEFAVYNADGSIAGAVDCRKKSTSCSGLFWLKQSRVVRYRFEKKHLPNILKIHHEIDAMIDKATVKEKTDDLNIEGETR